MTLAKSRESTRRSSNETPDDYSVYPHRDFAGRKSIRFRIDDYGDAGALSEQQISILANRHNLPEEHVATLSRLVGYALDIDTDANLVKISRSSVQRRLSDPRTLYRPITNTLSSEKTNALFASLSLPVFVAEEEVAGLQAAKMSESETGAGAQPIDLDTARRVLVPDDKRDERDSRRLLVVECCCYAALDAGWSVSFTTDSSRATEIRTGPLLELIRDVIEMASETGERASVDTLARDITLVKERFRMRGDL